MIVNCYEYITSLFKLLLKIDTEVALTISYGGLFQKLIVRTPKSQSKL